MHLHGHLRGGGGRGERWGLDLVFLAYNFSVGRSSPFCLAGRDEVASGDVEIRFPVATCGDPVCSSVVVSADMHMQHPCLPRRVPHSTSPTKFPSAHAPR